MGDRDRAVASDPGRLGLSEAKLRALEPALFEPRTFKCGSCEQHHTAEDMRAIVAEGLHMGDSRAALVVSDRPLVVAAYSEDLDAGWSNFRPLIAEFLSDDVQRIAARKAEIDTAEWRRLKAVADRRIGRFGRFGLGTARSGKPSASATPVRTAGDALFAPLGGFPPDGGSTVALRILKSEVVLWLVAIAVMVLLVRCGVG